MKRYIILRKPADINLQSKKREIRQHLENGCTTSNILLKCYFVATDEVVMNVLDTFRITKNQIALSLDTRFKK